MSKKIATVAALLVVLGGAAVAEAGRVGGPVWDVFTLNGGQSATYHERFYGNELAEVTVRGNGNTTLQVYVYDQNNNLIRRTSGPGDQIRVTWTPRWTGPFRIVVVNEGFGQNTYTYRTN